LPCKRQYPVELYRRRRRVPRSKLNARGEANAFLHGRQTVPGLGVHDRPCEPGVTVGAEMAMVAPFQHERQLDPHRSKHIRSKRSQGHDGFGGIQRTLIRVNSPMRPASTERTRISTNQEAAQCFETGGISLGERKRASDARHSLPEDGTM